MFSKLAGVSRDGFFKKLLIAFIAERHSLIRDDLDRLKADRLSGSFYSRDVSDLSSSACKMGPNLYSAVTHRTFFSSTFAA